MPKKLWMALLLLGGCSSGPGIYVITIDEATFLTADAEPQVCLVEPSGAACSAPPNFDYMAVNENDVAESRVEMRVGEEVMLSVALAAEETTFTDSSDGRTLTASLKYEGE